MISPFNLKQRRLNKGKQFQEFVFIGKTADKLRKNLPQQLQLSPNNTLISEAAVEDSLLITQVRTSTNINHQLKNLNIKPGTIVKLVSKTNNGSVIISLGSKLIGIGAEIAREIIAIPAI